MKKILFILACLLPVAVFGQAIDWDSTTHATSTATSDYIPIFKDSPKSVLTMSAEYAFPWVYSASLLIPRTIGYNIALGSSTNPYTDKLYVGGTGSFSGNLFGMSRVYVGSARTSYFSTGTGNVLQFTDAINGTKTLTELAAAGAGVLDTTGLPVLGQVPVFTSATNLGGYTNLRYVYNTLRLAASTADTALYLTNASTGKLVVKTNTSSGYGGYTLNSGSGYGEYMVNSGTATGYYVANSSTMNAGIYCLNVSGSIRGISSYSQSGGGVPLSLYNYGSNHTMEAWNGTSLMFTIEGDSVTLPLYANDYEQWAGYSVNGALFADSIDNSGFMLTLSPFEPVDEFLKDTKLVGKWNELKWFYLDRKTGEVRWQHGMQGIKPMEQMNALMAGIERAYIYIGEQHDKINVLESELRKVQYDLDKLKRNYSSRLRLLEDKINSK
jgi:hypothetical protein